MDWEQVLSEALQRAAEQRIADALSKPKTRGHYQSTFKQTKLDDFRRARAVIQNGGSEDHYSSASGPVSLLLSQQTIRVQHAKEDIEALLGGDAYLSQPTGKFPPFKHKEVPDWQALKRLVLTDLALSPSKTRDGTLSPTVVSEIQVAVDQRIKMEEKEKKERIYRRVTMPDINAAEDVLHSRRIKQIKKEVFRRECHFENRTEAGLLFRLDSLRGLTLVFTSTLISHSGSFDLVPD